MKKTLLLLSFISLLTGAVAQKRILVARDGSGDFKTVQEAINAAPELSEEVTEIRIKPGVYKERIVVSKTKTNISLVGEDPNRTILTWDNYASKQDSAGNQYGTSGSASFYAYGAGFTARNITFENSSGPVGQALAIYIGGDKARFFNCRFLGCQDTILTNGAGSREYFYDCYIEGTVDFIFGPATALFEKCRIFCKRGGLYITAASTPDTVKYGYVFRNCTITGDAPENSFLLGRPWRPYAKVVFIQCSLDKLIRESGWDNWRNPENEKTAYYAEYQNTGPGFKPSGRVSWSRQLTDAEAKTYTTANILRNWDPTLWK
jgi:pectinesterase